MAATAHGGMALRQQNNNQNQQNEMASVVMAKISIIGVKAVTSRSGIENRWHARIAPHPRARRQNNNGGMANESGNAVAA